MKHIKLFSQFVNEKTSGEIFNPKKGQKIKFDHRKYPELANEFFELIQTAYAEIGGHSKITNPDDIFSDPDWNYWAGTDIHGTPDFDIIVFCKKTKYGIKYAGVGHDGSKQAKRKYIEQRGADLKKLGYYVEVSGRIAEILINGYNVPIVNSKEDVEKIIGKPVEWLGKHPNDPKSPGDGWYRRILGGKPHNKIMIGRPKI
jgi:hypothetical protein